MLFDVETLVRLAAAGGGFKINAEDFYVDDLIKIAVAAGSKQSRIVVTKADEFDSDDLIRIAEAGKGCMLFEF
ncbi:hypothetical protein [Ruegeria arenilitoris]|uniref:hypothetical protein n=1 Tax=Ruegeria arenilitoris TaxID=1173585 RepID=UPI003C7B9385